MTCNPFDVDGLAQTMAACLELPVDERRERLARMAAKVHDDDVFAWGEALLQRLVESTDS